MEKLDLSDIGRVSISNDGFRPFMRLLDLNLAGASLSVLNSEWFDEYNSITRLDLSHNELTTIRRTDLKSLKNLSEITLAGNNIVEVEANAFDDARRLVMLNLRANRISTIPNMGELYDLKVLDLSENAIAQVG